MPPKAFQKVELSKTKRTDHDDRQASNFGEQQVTNCTIPYPGVRSVTNATVNAQELQQGIRSQKAAFAAMIQEHQEYRRIPKGQRFKKHRLPVEEEYAEDGDVILKRKSTTTKRMEN